MTKEERLRKLNSNRDYRREKSLYYWECEPDTPRVSLSHIHHSARSVGIHGSKKLQQQLQYLINRYPQFTPKVSTETIASNLVMADLMRRLGFIQSPLNPILVYLIWMDWKDMNILRHKKPLRRQVYNDMERLDILKLVVSESKKYLDKPWVKYLTPKYTKEQKLYVESKKGKRDGITPTKSGRSRTTGRKDKRTVK